MRLNFDTRVGAQDVSSGVRPRLHRPAQILPLLGLQYNRPFHRDPVFLLLLALGPMTWLSMIAFFPFQPLPRHAMLFSAFLSVALWQPLFEELLFRGIIQGQLLQTMCGGKTWIGLSLANLLTSVAFSFAHLAGHSISWSLLVFIPSLCFGLVRDRFGSVYPSIVLHVFYNTGYFLLIQAPPIV